MRDNDEVWGEVGTCWGGEGEPETCGAWGWVAGSTGSFSEVGEGREVGQELPS